MNDKVIENEASPMEGRLQYILGEVNEWLRYAEQKNAGVLVFNCTLAAAIVTILPQCASADTLCAWWVRSILLLLALSAVTALCSFIPRIDLAFLKRRKEHHRADNLVFFGEAANYDPEAYLKALYLSCNLAESENAPAFMRHYAEQIVQNSRIAKRKFEVFKVAVWLTVAAFVTIPVALVLFIFLCWKKCNDDY
ncbi:MAG: hypothetical protein J5J00_15390 [Deltaproteobacteria bacterium]|nr:hypothetical protein [Deltaproteobacteria bacterium]